MARRSRLEAPNQLPAYCLLDRFRTTIRHLRAKGLDSRLHRHVDGHLLSLACRLCANRFRVAVRPCFHAKTTRAKGTWPSSSCVSVKRRATTSPICRWRGGSAPRTLTTCTETEWNRRRRSNARRPTDIPGRHAGPHRLIARRHSKATGSCQTCAVAYAYRGSDAHPCSRPDYRDAHSVDLREQGDRGPSRRIIRDDDDECR
jgi:hypothetical protein